MSKNQKPWPSIESTVSMDKTHQNWVEIHSLNAKRIFAGCSTTKTGFSCVDATYVLALDAQSKLLWLRRSYSRWILVFGLDLRHIQRRRRCPWILLFPELWSLAAIMYVWERNQLESAHKPHKFTISAAEKLKLLFGSFWQRFEMGNRSDMLHSISSITWEVRFIVDATWLN